jgi:hypothetical protein
MFADSNNHEPKKFDLCLSILSDVDVTVAGADPFLLQYSIDRLLRNLVKSGLTAKLTDVPEKGAARIGSSLTRVEALTLIMRYYTKANDKEAAQRILIEASKVAGSSSDNWDKAKAFFLLSATCDQVDGSKKADLLLSGLKALNNVSESDMNARDKTIYQSFAQRLDNVGYDLSRGFKSLTKHDETEALALVEKLQNPGLRTFALIGILSGLDGLLTEQVTK